MQVLTIVLQGNLIDPKNVKRIYKLLERNKINKKKEKIPQYNYTILQLRNEVQQFDSVNKGIKETIKDYNGEKVVIKHYAKILKRIKRKKDDRLNELLMTKEKLGIELKKAIKNIWVIEKEFAAENEKYKSIIRKIEKKKSIVSLQMNALLKECKFTRNSS